MSLDPVLGGVIGLLGVLATGFLGAWFATLFDKPAPKPRPTAAE